jgi:hypothetical protein
MDHLGAELAPFEQRTYSRGLNKLDLLFDSILAADKPK